MKKVLKPIGAFAIGIVFNKLLLLLAFATLLVCACSGKHQSSTQLTEEETDSLSPTDCAHSSKATPLQPEPASAKSRTARYLDSLGFINIAQADSSIAIELMYARAGNFTGEVLYEDLREAYLHPDAMESLSKAQRLLQEVHPRFRLIVYDAARPMSVQQKMWDVVKGTPQYIYVSNPARGGGLHNYGLAVDVSILDATGKPLPMGTPVDFLGKEAHITEEARLVNEGKITAQERENRLLLRQVMTAAGFRALPSEWWHFNRYSRQTAKEKYRVIP